MTANSIPSALTQTREFRQRHPDSHALLLIEVQLRYLAKVYAGRRAERKRLNKINLPFTAASLGSLAPPSYLSSLQAVQIYAEHLRAQISRPARSPRAKESYYRH